MEAALIFEPKQILAELGQLASAIQRSLIDHIRHVALFVTMLLGLLVEHELRQGAMQPGNLATHHGKT